MKLSEKTFFEHINKRWPALRKQRILLALSGGVDSMVMAHLFIRTGFSVGVAHVNYGLRGIDSNLDEQVVENFATDYDLPYFSRSADFEMENRKAGKSLQMEARSIRYQYFAQIVEVFKFDMIATAHQLNDEAETVLLNMLRGAGYQGFDGISEDNTKIIRPLLPFSRNEILQYAEKEGIIFRHDESNFSDKYERNFIRNRLLPLMEERFEGAVQTLADFASHWKNYGKLLDEVLSLERQKMEFRAGRGMYPLVELHDRPSAAILLYELLKPHGFNAEQSEALFNAHQSGKTGIWVDGIAGKRAGISNGMLKIEPISEGRGEEPYEIAAIGKWYETPFGKFKLSKSKPKLVDAASLAASHWVFPLKIRKWQPGDRFQPTGMKGSKKISDFLTGHKLSKGEKENAWVMEHDGEIIWVNGLRTSESVKPDEGRQWLWVQWEAVE